MMTACVVISADDCQAEVTGTGYAPFDGDCLQNGELVSGSERHPSIACVIEIGCICNNAQLANGTVIGQPTEGALMVLAIKTNMYTLCNNIRRLHEIPFTSDSKWMAVQVEQLNKPGEVETLVKGAIDRILDICIGYLENGKIKMQMTKEKYNQIIQTASGLGQSGLRVIGMARGSDMRSLYYAGLVGILDPPRPGCLQSIEIVQSAGVSVKIVTGYGLETAKSIGIRLGLYKQNIMWLSGPQIDDLKDSELEQLIQSVTIFYKASPRHKLRIVKALQNIGEVVAMTGDGVNDAVACKKSDIGAFYSLPTEAKLDVFKCLNHQQLCEINQTNLYFYNFINNFEGELAREEFDEISIGYLNKYDLYYSHLYLVLKKKILTFH
uniref:Uncharacterized protein n=1 Tax=Meloidogyne enterolobii TaxID=390850 RepID=A0A6V7XTL6_MELEN|nr:unnamed protein product [Meloidogyne enterolobii]